MSYAAPLAEIGFVLDELCLYADIAALPGLEDADRDLVASVLEEAGKFAGTVLAPLNRIGDKQGATWSAGVVTTPPGWIAAYKSFTESGWNSPAASAETGGMGLPHVVNAAIQEIFQSANMAFALCPMLTQGAIEAIEKYAAPELRAIYLGRLVSGEWTGAMDLTEPQAGSDLAAVRTSAVPDGDVFRLKGQKIFITYGEHDMADNIVHLVLARLPDAPAGVKGISLFLVPKFLVEADGSIGARNDVTCVSIEHKLGIHGSPTCTMVYGDGPGALGFLIGEANRGLEYMFTMMNAARLSVGLQGVGIAERAYQQALVFARERKQGRAPGASGSSAIIEHADVARMLGLMRGKTEAARAICYQAAAALDFATRSEDAEERARQQRRVDLLIPIAKGWSTEIAVEVASLGIQVHGGMGFIEETGAAQYSRDARITTIYEGTTGIQALDLVGRKIARDKGQAVAELIEHMRASGSATDRPVMGTTTQAAHLLEEAARWLLNEGTRNAALPGAAAVNVLHLFGICIGAWQAAEASHAAIGTPFAETKAAMAAFYADQIFPEARARLEGIVGSSAVLKLRTDLFN
jgi:alkylation response protein AidB-like acyl-CoA dehydrogenase